MSPSSDSDELITGQYIKTLPGVVTHVMSYLPLDGSEKHLLIAVVFRSVRTYQIRGFLEDYRSCI
jgi:hypothetical protein